MKTNAMRLLESLKIPYQMREYETRDGANDGVSVALKTGQNPARVFKTLVTKGASGAVLVFCVPVESELDLKRAAKAAKEKSIAMLPLANVTPVTGYIKGGVSPMGMKKRFPTFLDASAMGQETILVSGGKVGLQIELAPGDLLRATDGAVME